jgi:hypothetical protein
MRFQLTVCVVLAAAALAGSATAAPYVDYGIEKGAWHVITLRVDPSHLDDYITGLKRTWAPSEAIAKRHGMIDSYQIMSKLNPEGGDANVLLIEHIPNLALLEPDQARDLQLLSEFRATLSKEARDQALGAFDKYRTFVRDELWKELTFTN